MDSAQFLAKYAETAGLIDRLENLALWARTAYIAEDRAQFDQFVGEYGRNWQLAQGGIIELGEAALHDALSANLDIGRLSNLSPSNLHEELTNRLVIHTNAMHEFMAGVKRESPGFLVSGAVGSSKSAGGCYIATAIYGSYDSPEVLMLRRFRDRTLARHAWGRGLIALYYRFSPPVARRLEHASPANRIVRIVLDAAVRRMESE